MISIIVPVYNVEKYLRKCVNSLINQSYKDLEIILVDDGSRDGSGDICDKFVEVDDRIKVIHKSNNGLSSARNAGIDISSGDYLAFVDSDDFVDVDMYRTLYLAITKSGMDVACCGRIVDVFGQYNNQEFVINEEQIFLKEEAIREVLFLEKIDVSACDKLYRKKLFTDIRYPEGKISEDAAVIFEILEKSNGVIHVGRPLYHYVYRNNSITKSKYYPRKFDIIDNLSKTKEFLKQYHPSLLKEYKVYCAINTGALILNMENDPDSKEQYSQHYSEYRKLFLETVDEALHSPNVNNKMKMRLFAIKVNGIKTFKIMKKMYGFIRRIRA